MIRDQRLLVALSRTQHDQPLIEYARMLAETGLVRELRFLHVIAPSGAREPRMSMDDIQLLGYSTATAADREPPDPADVERRFEETISPQLKQLGDAVLASYHAVAGEREDMLLDAATRWRSDLILLGHRRGRSGQRSLARRLAMIAPCSVWMVPEGAPVSISRILAPVDFSDPSADALAAALDIAQRTDAENCLALHVYFDSSTVRYPEHKDRQRAMCEQAFEAFLDKLDTNEVSLDSRCEEGAKPAKTILRIAGDQQADLIVMNTRGKSRAAAILLGNVTTQVMVETPVAILVVKHFGAVTGLFNALRESHFWRRPNPKMN